MPILQSRMIALIEAALDYQHAYQELSHLIHAAYINVEQGRADAANALQSLALMANDHNLLENAGKSQAAINQEHYHFKRNLNRNVKEREYQEKRRGTPRVREHFEPHYASEQFGSLAQRSIPFRAPNQNKRGDIPKYTPKDIPAESKWEIENRPPTDLTSEQEDEYKAFIRRRDEEARQRSKDPFQSTGEKDETEL